MYQEDEKKAVRDAFERVKNDIFVLGTEFSTIRNDIFELKSMISSLNSRIDKLETDFISPQTSKSLQTNQQINPAHSAYPADIPTVPSETGGLKYPNFNVSSGNGGVPTDRQTNQQTDKPTHFYTENASSSKEKSVDETIYEASELISSLDSIKKEIRRKFRNITQQEMLVFSTIYQLEDQLNEAVDYRSVASKLGLSESSIRDYVQKLIGKGIPVVKTKINNKKIAVSISSNLRKIAPLQTIIKLKEL